MPYKISRQPRAPPTKNEKISIHPLTKHNRFRAFLLILFKRSLGKSLCLHWSR